MDYKNTKIRIVRKQKDGITLRVKGNEIKFSWEEFNDGYNIVDNIWAVMKDSFIARMEKLDSLISDATATYFILQNSVPGIQQLSHAAVLSNTIEEIRNLLKCTNFEALQLVKKNIDNMNTVFNSDKSGHTRAYYKKQKMEMNKDKFPKRVETPVNSSSCVMADNPALLKLKEKYNATVTEG